NVPSSPTSPSWARYRYTRPRSSVSPLAVASIVANMRGSSAAMKPTIGIMRFEASRSSEPKDCVNAPTRSFQPWVRMAPALAPRTVANADRCAPAPSREMRQLALGEIAFTADAEHDLQVATATELRSGGVGHEVEELLRLVGTRRDP